MLNSHLLRGKRNIDFDVNPSNVEATFVQSTSTQNHHFMLVVSGKLPAARDAKTDKFFFANNLKGNLGKNTS